MSKPTLQWHTAQRRINDLLPHPKNPRTLDDQQRDALIKSLKKFGLAEIPAINTDNRILAGHQRIKVLQLLGRGEELIDVRIPARPLTKAEANQYLLTSNAVHGSWDFELLKEFPTDLILDIGFSENDIAGIFDDALETEDDGWDEEAERKKLKRPIVKLGELYQLGNHRLICGDSQDPAVIKRLVGDTRIDLIDFDPPYNIDLKYEGTKGQYGGSYKDNKSDTDYRKFLKALIQNSTTVAKDNVHCFVWCDQNYIGVVQSLYEELGVSRKRVCTWIKNNQNPTPQVAFNKATESCVYGAKGKPYLSPRTLNLNEVANKEVGSGTRTIDDIVDLFEIWLVKRIPTSQYEHPTQKPPTLHEKAIRRCTKPGDTILDVTAGSGSIMVAAEQLKRRTVLCEADPMFATLIIKRFEKLTNLHAKKLK